MSSILTGNRIGVLSTKMAMRLSHISLSTSLFIKDVCVFSSSIVNRNFSSYTKCVCLNRAYSLPNFSPWEKKKISSQSLLNTSSSLTLAQGSSPSSKAPFFIVPSRYYGRKVKPKPQKITFFEYSGDLRTVPEIDKEELLFPYLDYKDELDRDEVIKKLSSVEFASVVEQNKHKEEMIRDRILELFGPDSELEQRIALFTLKIRQMIPYCIQNRTDKFQKIWLLKAIFHRRRLLTTLRQLDHERFEWLLRELKIRYVIPQDQEGWKGWKYNLEEATKNETLTYQRKKLEEFKDKLDEEKDSFAKRKAKILEAIDRDLEVFGLTRDFLDEVQKKEVEKKRPHKILNWEERVKLGMTDKIKDYYG